jgi:hypothetical protein
MSLTIFGCFCCREPVVGQMAKQLLMAIAARTAMMCPHCVSGKTLQVSTIGIAAEFPSAPTRPPQGLVSGLVDR